MVRSIALGTLALGALIVSLAGCGVAETGASAAAIANSKAAEVRQGLATEQRVKQQLDIAAQQAAEQRKSVDAAN